MAYANRNRNRNSGSRVRFNPNTGRPLGRGESTTFQGRTYREGSSNIGGTGGSSGGSNTQDPNTPRYTRETGLLTDYGRSLGLSEVSRSTRESDVITSEAIAPMTAIPIATPPTPTNYSPTLAGVAAGYPAVTTETTNTGVAGSSVEDTIRRITGAYAPPTDTASIYDKAQKEAGVRRKQQLVNTYTNQIQTINQNAQANQLALTNQGRGIPETIIGGQQAEISKQATIEALRIAPLLSAAQGDLEMAQSHLDTLFKIRVSDAEAKTNYHNKIVDLAYSMFDKQEQRQLDDIKTDRATNIQTMRDAVNFTQSLASQALKDGNNGAFRSLTSLVPPDPASKTFKQDLIKYNKDVARYGGIGGGGKITMDEDLNAYSAQYADTGKLPSPAELKLSGLSVGQVTSFAKQLPKPKGALVSTNTGTKSSALTPAQEDGIIALSEIVNSTIPSLKDKFGKLESGVLGRIGASLYTTQNRQDFRTFRDEFLNKLLKARSGGAVTPEEYDRYAALVPSEMANAFLGGFSDKGGKKLTSLGTSMKSTLDSNLNSQQLSIYGYSKVKVNGIDRTVGEVLDIDGVPYRVLPDGNLTDII